MKTQHLNRKSPKALLTIPLFIIIRMSRRIKVK